MCWETVSTILKDYNHVANWLIAIVAVGGFLYSIRSSWQATKSSENAARILKGIEGNLAAQTVATIGFSDCGWFVEGQVSCDNPPKGVFIRIQNMSTVPIQLISNKTNYYYGDMEIPKSGEERGSSGSTILYPGKTTQFGMTNKEVFQECLKVPKSVMDPPFVRVAFEAIFRRLNDSQNYKYKTTIGIGFDCRNPNQQQHHRESELIEPIPDE